MTRPNDLDEPKLPAAPALQTKRSLHPAAMEAAATYSEAIERAERAESRAAQLEVDLQVVISKLNNNNQDYNRERDLKERYMRHSVVLETQLDNLEGQLDTMRRTIQDLRARALDIAKRDPSPPMEHDQGDTLERAIAEAAKDAVADDGETPEQRSARLRAIGRDHARGMD